jgi:hypothetical protein
MAASTLPADRRWPRRAALIVALLAGALPIGCALFQPGEPHASRDVLDAIYDGMKRAQQPAPPTG